MYIDADGLHAGADTSYRAADVVYESACTLARSGVGGSIFGDFTAAAAFRDAVSDVHGRHSTLLGHNADRFAVLGDKAHRAAAEFREMEATNTERLTF